MICPEIEDVSEIIDKLRTLKEKQTDFTTPKHKVIETRANSERQYMMPASKVCSGGDAESCGFLKFPAMP